MRPFRIAVARVKWGWWTREWPWRVPREVVYIGTKRPPEHVFEFFRRLHGVGEGNDE